VFVITPFKSKTLTPFGVKFARLSELLQRSNHYSILLTVYRTLVAADATGSWKCYYESCRTTEETRLRSTSGTDDIGCYCEHISKVKQELDPTLQLDDDVATKVKSTHLELNPPYSMKCHFLLPFVKTCRKWTPEVQT